MIAHLDYYTILAAARMALVMMRIGLLLVTDGLLFADNDAWYVNSAVQRLAELSGAQRDDGMLGYREMVVRRQVS